MHLSRNIIFTAVTVLFLGAQAFSAETNLQYFFGNAERYQDIVVEEVLSADTIKLKDGETIKLIGLKAPEPPKRKKEVELDEYHFPVEGEADPTVTVEELSFKFAQKLLKGKHVRLEFDVERKDMDFKTLAYVFILDKNIFANAEIIRQGYANLQLTPANKKYETELRSAYHEAKEEKRGLQNE